MAFLPPHAARHTSLPPALCEPSLHSQPVATQRFPPETTTKASPLTQASPSPWDLPLRWVSISALLRRRGLSRASFRPQQEVVQLQLSDTRAVTYPAKASSSFPRRMPWSSPPLPCLHTVGTMLDLESGGFLSPAFVSLMQQNTVDEL